MSREFIDKTDAVGQHDVIWNANKWRQEDTGSHDTVLYVAVSLNSHWLHILRAQISVHQHFFKYVLLETESMKVNNVQIPRKGLTYKGHPFEKGAELECTWHLSGCKERCPIITLLSADELYEWERIRTRKTQRAGDKCAQRALTWSHGPADTWLAHWREGKDLCALRQLGDVPALRNQRPTTSIKGMGREVVNPAFEWSIGQNIYQCDGV